MLELLAARSARNHRAGSPPVTSAQYLDGLSQLPITAVSLKKLISTATASIRVRRGSDNTEQDIGFAGDVLDAAALLSFAGTGDAYVVKFYDQTGNNNHLLQATVSRQPKIVSAGSVLTAALFDGISCGMSFAALAFGTPYVGMFAKMAFPGSYSGNPVVYELSSEFTKNQGCFASYYAPEGGKLWSVQSHCGGTQRQVMSPSWSGLSVVDFIYNTTGASYFDEIKLVVNGQQQAVYVGDASAQTGNYAVGQNLFIVCRNNISNFTRMDLHSLAIYNQDTSAIRNTIETVISS